MFKPKKETPPPRTIGLLTDFGLADPYVGQMKAVLARKAPHCRLVDITHDVVPFNVAQAGFFLAASHPHFPKNAVLLSVVDPGVGTNRKIVALRLDERILIAPDNGLLSLALTTTTADEIHAYDLSEALNAPAKVAPTFHGRDVFAPLAAWIALGGSLRGLGGEIDPATLISQPWSTPEIGPNHATAHVLHIDRFGNCVLNLGTGSLPNLTTLKMVAPTATQLKHVTTYAELDGPEAGLLEGSQGFLEIAVNQQPAADTLSLSMGDQVELSWEE